MTDRRVGLVGLDVYRSDSNLETISPIENPITLNRQAFGSQFKVLNEKLYFNVGFVSPNGSNLNQLWSTDGVNAAAMVHDFVASTSFTGVRLIAATGKRLYMLFTGGVFLSEGTEESKKFFPSIHSAGYLFDAIEDTLFAVTGRRGAAGNGPTTIYSVWDGEQIATPVWTEVRQVSNFRKFRNELDFIDSQGSVLCKIAGDGVVVDVATSGITP